MRLKSQQENLPPGPSTTSSTIARRTEQREALLVFAERLVAEDGLSALRARRLADGIGCSVGAIYNLVTDLDELTLLVGQRTMADLGSHLDAVALDGAAPDLFVGWALAYCRFAAAHRNRWRALFEFRLPPGRDLPDWFMTDQMRLFERIEAGLTAHMPHLTPSIRRLRARILFSAVHGIVALGLEEKLAAMPVGAIEIELESFVRTYLAGLEA